MYRYRYIIIVNALQLQREAKKVIIAANDGSWKLGGSKIGETGGSLDVGRLH